MPDDGCAVRRDIAHHRPDGNLWRRNLHARWSHERSSLARETAHAGGESFYLRETSDEFPTAFSLQYFREQTSTVSFSLEWQELMAASLVVLLPTLVIFFVGQRYFVQGITLTGMKG